MENLKAIEIENRLVKELEKEKRLQSELKECKATIETLGNFLRKKMEKKNYQPKYVMEKISERITPAWQKVAFSIYKQGQAFPILDPTKSWVEGIKNQWKKEFGKSKSSKWVLIKTAKVKKS